MLDDREVTPVMPTYAAAIFLSAFLLFQVQPQVSKYVLPWFGGAPAVWTTCLLFFQVLLLVGYGYAHLLVTRLRPRWQFRVHLGVMVGALAFLPIVPAESWKEHLGGDPIVTLLLLLLVTVGLPFAALSATGPLLQAWFARTLPGRSPYPLYALSNAGSLLALLSFPFLVEPNLTRGQQATVWSGGFVAFVLVCGVCAWRSRAASGEVALGGGEGSEAEGEAPADEAPPGGGDWLMWVGLAASGSMLLMAVTNQLCVDIANTPFLWVMPLTVYLLTFILCFSGEGGLYGRGWTSALLVVVMLGTGGVALAQGNDTPVQLLIVAAGLFLFAACMLCHGELYRLRPGPRHLTSFYLAVSIGGAVGGVLVGVVAPLVFPLFLELQLGFLLGAACVIWVWLRDPTFALNQGRARLGWAAPAGLVLAVALSTAFQLQFELSGAVAVTRNFYGVLRVTDEHPDDPRAHRRLLLHGTTFHGAQYQAADRQLEPTSYYSPESGIGLAFAALRQRGRPLHVGVVGLGAGVLLVHGRAGDRFRLYELDPEVVRMAKDHFTYLRDVPVEQTEVIGDGRLSLEREPLQGFDLLVLDAFSSHAPPLHLLTREALALYLTHLRPDGVLALNISNLFLDLTPVVWALAEEHGLTVRLVSRGSDPERGVFNTRWALLAKDPRALAGPAIVTAHQETLANGATDTFGPAHRWTDDYCSLFAVLR